MLRSLDYRAARGVARLHAVAETGAGVLLVLGLLTPLAIAAIIGVMLTGIVVGLVVGLAVLTLGREHASQADDASGRAATA